MPEDEIPIVISDHNHLLSQHQIYQHPPPASQWARNNGFVSQDLSAGLISQQQQQQQQQFQLQQQQQQRDIYQSPPLGPPYQVTSFRQPKQDFRNLLYNPQQQQLQSRQPKQLHLQQVSGVNRAPNTASGPLPPLPK